MENRIRERVMRRKKKRKVEKEKIKGEDEGFRGF